MQSKPLWACEPPKVISLSLDFSLAGGDDLGVGSNDSVKIDSDAVRVFD